jgi:hypothetical protein
VVSVGVQFIQARVRDWEWKQVAADLGLEPNIQAMESVFELYEDDLQKAMEQAGTVKLKNLLRKPEIQMAFRLKKLTRSKEDRGMRGKEK